MPLQLDHEGSPIPDSDQNQNPNPENQSTGPTNNPNHELDLLRQIADTNARNAREEARRREELEVELRNLRNQQNTPTPRALTPEEYYADPVTALNSAIAAQVAPLREFTVRMERQQAYQTLKNQFLANPQYSQIVQGLGFDLDNVMANLEPTHNNMLNAIHSLVGRYALSNPQLFAPKDSTPPKDPSVVGDITPSNNKPTPVTPPHLRPSGAPQPNSSNQPNAPKKNYTENEKRLMREGGYTEEEWEVLMSSGSDLDAVRRFRASKKK